MLKYEIALRAVLTAKELLLRWPGISEDMLASIVKGRELLAFLQMRKLRSPDGGTVYYCRPGATPWGENDVLTGEYYWENVLFRMEDVEGLEAEHPEFKWPLIDEAAPEVLSASEMAEILEPLREENKALASQVTRLKEISDNLRNELNAERAKPSEETLKPPRTAAASKAASNLKAEEWKRHAAHMVKIALQCGIEGPKPRKRPQLQTIAKRYGGALPKTALQVLWEALPDDHISKEPGPQRQD